MYLKINIFIIRFYNNLIHHLTIWQRAYDAGRDRGHGRGQVHFTGARCAPVLFGQIRYNEAPEIQVPFRRRPEKRL